MIALLMWTALAQEIDRQAAEVRRLAAAGEVEKADDAHEELLVAAAKDRDGASRMEATLRNAYEAVGRIEHEWRVARRMCDAAKEGLDALDEERVRRSVEMLARLRKRPSEPDRELESLAAEIDALANRVTARIRLRRAAIVLTGVGQRTVERTVRIVLMTVTVRVAEAWAIINEKLYQVGDEIEGTGVRVDKIMPHGVAVTLGGERREIAPRRP